MNKIKIETILFATDLLENSRLALDYAVAFAEHFSASIVMVHVVQLSGAAQLAELQVRGPSVTRHSAEERLNVLARGVRRLGLAVEAEVLDGLTCNAILEAADRHRADLLVLGVHGIHRGLEHLLIGSNTEKIMLSASCPVLTVGSHVLTGFDTKLHLKEILLLSDFTPESALAVPYAFQLAEEFALPVEVCQLLPDGAETTRDQLAEDYCRALRNVLEDRNSEWCKPAFQLDRGMAIDQIVYRAESQNAGLIVLGAHTETQLGRHFRTSFAYQVLGRATCPVLTVRSDLAL